MRATLHGPEPAWSIRQVCATLGVARSAYYHDPVEADDLALRAGSEAIILECPRYGYRRVTAPLRRRGQVANHKRVLRVMREASWLVEGRHDCRTTNSQPPYGRYPNRLKGLVIARPDQVWAADITSIRLPREFVSLAVVLDLYTRGSRGWALERPMTEALPLGALERALTHRRPEIQHSDQGAQSAAHGYVGRLEAIDVAISLAAVGRPTENAIAERFMRTLKEKDVSRPDYQGVEEARSRIGRLLDDVEQTKRIHSALGDRTPDEFEAACTIAH